MDMIKKAYQNQYEIAILFSGDEDLLDIVNAIKDSGKRVGGVYFKGSISESMLDAFDVLYEIESRIANEWVMTTP